MTSSRNQTVNDIGYSNSLLLKILVVVLFLLFSMSVSANERQKFWYWLENVEEDLGRAGEFSHENDFRMRGYFNAVSTRLKTLNPNLEGELYDDAEGQHTLYLSSGGNAEAIEEIKALEKSLPSKTRLKIETFIEPRAYEYFEIFLTDKRSVYTDQIRFKLSQVDQKVNIELYIPELDSIEERMLESMNYRLKNFVIRLIGESVFGRKILDINFLPLLSDLNAAYPLSELNSQLRDE